MYDFGRKDMNYRAIESILNCLNLLHTPDCNADLDAMAEARVVDKPKVTAKTPVAITPTTITGFRPNLSANMPQA